MNEHERLELLKRVASVAPKEMGAKLTECGHVEFANTWGGWTSADLTFKNAVKDASAMVVMLDAMEKAGFGGELIPIEDGYGGFSGHDYKPFEMMGHPGNLRVNPLRALWDDGLLEGEARVESVSKAFKAAFEHLSNNPS